MKIKGPISSLLLLVCLFSMINAALAQTPAPKPTSKFLKAKFDKGKNLTTVALKTLDLGGSMTKEVGNMADVPQLDLDGWFTYQGDQLTQQVPEATLTFKVTARHAVFLRAQNVVGILDDDRALVLGATSYKTNSQTFRFEELLSFNLPYEALQRISEAKSIKFMLGQREIKLREKDHEALRELARWMVPAG